jgi:phage repressor protein C with HTH and peptisase S24 domain
MVFSQQAFYTKSVLDNRSGISYQNGMKIADKTGKFPNYLRAYREAAGLTQEQLAVAGDTNQPTIVKLEKGQRQLTLVWAKKFESALKAPAIKILGEPPTPGSTPAPPADEMPPPAEQEAVLGPEVSRADFLAHDVPVLGTAMGGTDDDERPVDFWLTGDIENYVARPKGLANAKNLFSMYIGGDSMEPRFEERDMVFVQKAMPAIGDDVVIELHPRSDGGDHPTLIKRLVRRRGSYITVKQYNPPKELEFNMSEIKNLFRVIPLKELIG